MTATLAQSWRERLAELRAICRENGERLDAQMHEWMRQQHVDQWWAEFCRAADDGADIPEPVWRSAEKLGAERMPGYVLRLRVVNRMRRAEVRP